MSKLKFEYKMELKFSAPAACHYFALRCIPADSDRQKICVDTQLIEPTDYISASEDGFGNIKLSGCCIEPHENFGFLIKGTAQTAGMCVLKESLHPMYKYPSRYTRPDAGIDAFTAKIQDDCKAAGATLPLERAVCAMNCLYSNFKYESGVTNNNTTAAEALSLGKGVCQDYVHIMISVMRNMGIPARYVNGLMIGEGFTHAWIEIFTGEGWYGLDPTNNLHIDGYYIKLAHGRDFYDCTVDRGRFIGAASQSQEIYVNVEEITDDN